MIGQTLLHYEIIAKIGEGGMGVVWQARDTSLDREAAIKVLPEALAQDTERLARFEREAKLLASLNHPNIASVYGLHEAEGERFIAMELVGGEDLSERLARGPIPVDEAIEIARGITRALEAAHSNGVVHRDLKPANIRLTPEGEVKVLDFGLAKAFDPDPGTDSASLSLSPTLTAGHTVAGVILGTAAYMAPEQARGKSVDRRADIWAFGVVLYEMLGGTRLFEGETVSDVLAEVLKTEPDWTMLPTGTPASVRRVLRRCLTRDPRDRLHDIGDARLELEEEPELEAASVEAPAETPGWKRALPWAVAGLAILAAVMAWLGGPSEGDEPSPQQAVRFQIDIGDLDLMSGDLPFVLSPDGRTLAYVALSGTSTQIATRALDSLEAKPLPGTEDGHAPFFSPDGTWIGFFSNGRVMKAPVAGGNPRELCKIPHAPGGADWSEDGHIIFSTAFAAAAGLYRVSADGGPVEGLTVPDIEARELNHQWPQILPGQRHVLFTIVRPGQSQAAVLSLDSGEWRTLRDVTGRARFVPSTDGPGHIVYGDGETLLAAPFDLETMDIAGQAEAIMGPLPILLGGAGAAVQVSRTGVFAYLGAQQPRQNLVWIERDGTVTPLPIEPGSFHWPSISHDGRRLAATHFMTWGITVYDLERGASVKLDDAIYGIWTPDDRDLVHSSRRAGIPQVHRRSADGGGEIEQLTFGGELNRIVTSLSPGARHALMYEQHPETGRDIYFLDMEGTGNPESWLVTPHNERSAVFSPDGRWVAYTSNRSGRDEVYVRLFQPTDSRDVLVSRDGGREAIWAPDGTEVFYRAGSALLAVPVELDADEPRAGVPETLFEGSWGIDPGGFNQMYDVDAGGDRFLMIRNAEDLGLINVVLGWSVEDAIDE